MTDDRDLITAEHRHWIAAQQMFFVGTAPLQADGHVNVSPKGLDSLAILDDRTVAYLDYVGSGAETIAHLKENGRIVLMWCAFAGKPKILRMHGTGTVIAPDDAAFAALIDRFPSDLPGRSIIRVEVDSVRKSCGYGVPQMTFDGLRNDLPYWVEQRDANALETYQKRKNRRSLDDLPAVDWLE